MPNQCCKKPKIKIESTFISAPIRVAQICGTLSTLVNNATPSQLTRMHTEILHQVIYCKKCGTVHNESSIGKEILNDA
jgi:hypothetical protein